MSTYSKAALRNRVELDRLRAENSELREALVRITAEVAAMRGALANLIRVSGDRPELEWPRLAQSNAYARAVLSKSKG